MSGCASAPAGRPLHSTRSTTPDPRRQDHPHATLMCLRDGLASNISPGWGRFHPTPRRPPSLVSFIEQRDRRHGGSYPGHRVARSGRRKPWGLRPTIPFWRTPFRMRFFTATPRAGSRWPTSSTWMGECAGRRGDPYCAGAGVRGAGERRTSIRAKPAARGEARLNAR